MKLAFPFIYLSIFSLCLSIYACSSENEIEEPSKPCTTSICLDANALAVCDPTTGILRAETCPHGCDLTANQCKDIGTTVKCTSDICKNNTTLLVCNRDTSIIQEMPCSAGCDPITNRCKDAETSDKCTSDICQDDAFLLVCNAQTGTTELKRCEYLCDKTTNRCKDAETSDKCTSDLCQDDAYLLVCNAQTGATELKRCEYQCDITTNRCKDGPAKEKCTSNQCKDSSTLLVCNPSTGEFVESKCENGCSSNACVQKETCVPQCKSDNEAIICLEDGQTSTEKCPDGCDTSTGQCRPKSIIGEPCKTEADPVCEGNDFIYCAETSKGAVWTRMPCPEHYECKEYDGEVLCLETCSKAGENNTICGSGFLVKSICDTLDGKLYYLPDYDTGLLESCDNGCADRHVCME